MRTFLAILAIFFLAHTVLGNDLSVQVQETITIDAGNVTAAYAVNPTLAAVTALAGKIKVTGAVIGATNIVVMTATATSSIGLTVLAPIVPVHAAAAAGEPAARYEGRYAGSSGQIHNSLDVFTSDGLRQSQFHVLAVHHRRDARARSADAIASIYYRHSTPSRELILLDDFVDLSPVTIRNTQLRGLHFRQGPLEIHGGYAASSMYDDLFLPADRRWAAGAGYAVERNSIRWTPSVYAFFTERPDTAARRGVVATLAAEHRRGESLYARAEIGVSRSIAAAGEIRYTTLRDQLSGSFSLKPADYPTLGLSEVPGMHGEIDWTRRATDRLSVISYAAFDELPLRAFEQRTGVTNLALRFAVTPRLSVTSGADATYLRSPAVTLRTIGIPLGVAYDTPSFGMAAIYRVLDNSSTARRGDSIRVNARAFLRGFNANVWVQRQRQAPTLDLIFSADPALELALLRLGISVHTPEDVARALRESSALIDLGFITGVSLRLAPKREQAGLDLSWTSATARDQVRLHASFDGDEGISRSRNSLLSMLSYNRHVTAATEVIASYSWWRSDVGTQRMAGNSIDLVLRQQFSGMPKFLQSNGSIEGVAFVDPPMSGVRGAASMPLANVTVTLDGARTARTDANGAYAFRNVPKGRHKVAAALPDDARAFFTTPSHAEVNVPSRLNFGVVRAAGRVSGRVVNDAGLGIANAVISATSADGTPNSTTSNTDGEFVLVIAPGTLHVEVAAESLPDGYAVEGANERDLTVDANHPESISFVVYALRSIAGRAVGASLVRITSIGRTAPVDAMGNFVFRSMPAGTFTLSARAGDLSMTAVVTLPAEPTMLRNVIVMKTLDGSIEATRTVASAAAR